MINPSLRLTGRLTVTTAVLVGSLAIPFLTAPAAELARFEVTSVKPVDPADMHMMGVHVYPGGRITISSFPLKSLVATAFGLAYWQISGGDEWTTKDLYNIAAKPPASMNIRDIRYTNFAIEDPHLREMVQALLIDRFELKFHRETKTGDVYLMKLSGKPLRIHPLEMHVPGADSSEASSGFGSIGYAGGRWSIFATSMPQLAKYATDNILHAPVLDRTELRGSFDYRQRDPDLDPQYGGDQSDSFTHYLGEMGLKLERSKGPVESLVMDHAAKPSSN